MNKLQIKYRTAGKALPPQPIRLDIPGWAGSAEQKKENGSEPQPWHCAPFSEAAICGLELLYQYDTECHIINDGELRIDWDYAKEPGGVLGRDEFTDTAPKPSKFFLFATSVDLQAPPGYVLRTEPHPRFFTDTTGTVPLAVSGHVRSEWWAKKLFVAFKAPPPGQRHIFRKGEPYVQILFVPQHTTYQPTRMTAEEEAQRVEVEEGILLAKSHLATHVWHNPDGLEFNDHYKALERAFKQDGMAGVQAAVQKAVERFEHTVPANRTIAEYLDLGNHYMREGKLVEAKQVLYHARKVAPNNPEVANRNAILAWKMDLRELAVSVMQAAVNLMPLSAVYHGNLGDMLEQMGRHQEAEAALRLSLAYDSHNAVVVSNLALALAGQGRTAEALEACRAAVALAPQMALARFRLGALLAQQGERAEAQACFEAALAIDPYYAAAQIALKELTADTNSGEPRA
jgi:tetratricopeptide (TPR) repeat protein